MRHEDIGPDILLFLFFAMFFVVPFLLAALSVVMAIKDRESEESSLRLHFFAVAGTVAVPCLIILTEPFLSRAGGVFGIFLPIVAEIFCTLLSAAIFGKSLFNLPGAKPATLAACSLLALLYDVAFGILMIAGGSAA